MIQAGKCLVAKDVSRERSIPRIVLQKIHHKHCDLASVTTNAQPTKITKEGLAHLQRGERTLSVRDRAGSCFFDGTAGNPRSPRVIQSPQQQ